MSAIYDLADRYVEELAALDPVSATRVGIAGHEAAPSDYSPDGFAASADLDRRTLRVLEDLPPTGERDRVAADLMRERLQRRLERFDAGEHLRDLRIIASPFQTPRDVFDVQPRTTPELWEALAARLESVPAMLGGYLRTVSTGMERGTPPTRLQVMECISQAETWAGDGNASAFTRLSDEYRGTDSPDPALATRIAAAAVAAATAYHRAAEQLRGWLARAGEKDAVGRERYALGSRSLNGANLDFEETYAWAWDELHHLDAEAAKTAGRILPGATPAAARELLETDEHPGRSIEGVDGYRDWLQELHDQALADVGGAHFDVDPRINRVEVMIPPPGGALAAHYTGPSEDFSRPGRTWWPVPPGQTRFPKWNEVTTAYHEGVPGHHLEIGNRRCLETELSRYQRLFAGISGYSEGWALYAERLMHELGYLENPDHYMGYLSSQALRIVRVIIDIGMHLELTIPTTEPFHPGETWNHALGLEFIILKTGLGRPFMESELVRYLGWPGQAISYKVGERYWLQAREGAQKRLGPAFSLKDFHTRALNLGPMGLDQLQRELAK
jgi:uncharacterized protein (DUF885 family)